MVLTLAASEVEARAQVLLRAAGMSEPDAGTVAAALVWSDLRGNTPQGIAKLPLILGRLTEGGTRASGAPTTIVETPVFSCLDAHDTWGYVSGVAGMRTAVRLSRSSGLGVVSVRNTTSAGALGYYASLAADSGMVGIAINNTLPLLPGIGGIEPVVGNQAFAIAAPAHRNPTLLYDSALSAMTWNAIEQLPEGSVLPVGVAIDNRGHAIRDPGAVPSGMLLPLAGHRGFGLAVMWEILTGVLSGGSRLGAEIGSILDFEEPQSVSLLLVALDPTPTGVDLESRVDDLIDRVHASATQADVDRVLVPGERSAAVAGSRSAAGVPVPADLLKELDALAARLGVGAG